MPTGWSTQAKNSAADAVGINAGNNWIAAFEDDACTVEITGGAYTRKQTSYPAASGGATASVQVQLEIPAGKTVRGLGRFATASGGSTYDARTVSPAEPFPSGGKLNVTNNLTVA